ncbi:MAG: His/Gly/Thr/Pro-type tRNA ligase C-terminal domain-containing protein, partial [Acidobacteriota bacterium]
ERQKVPYMLVVGDKEMKSTSLMVRIRGQKEVKKMAMSTFLKRLKAEIEKRA